MIEHSKEWQAKRKELLQLIQETANLIGLNFNRLKKEIIQEIDRVDLFNPREFKNLERFIITKFRDVTTQATDEALKLVDDSADLAKVAGELTDKAVFGFTPPSPPSLGGGSKAAAEALKKERFSSGFMLSDNLWPSDREDLKNFFRIVQDGLKNGQALNKTVEKMANLKIDKAPERLPKFIQELEQAARGAAQGMPKAQREYRKLVKTIKDRLDKRKVGELVRPTQRPLGPLGTRQQTELFLARIDKAVKENSTQLIKEAVDEHLIKRAEYHSNRAARTMAGRAFRKAGQEERKKRPWVIGEKWTLSPSHPRFDECDLRASVDLGMGKGVYPVGQAPQEHVNGLCYLTDVIDDNYLDSGEAQEPTFNNDWKETRDLIEPGSKVSLTANRLGRQQNEAKIAREMKGLGKQGLVRKDAASEPFQKYTIQEVLKKVK